MLASCALTMDLVKCHCIILGISIANVTPSVPSSPNPSLTNPNSALLSRPSRPHAMATYCPAGNVLARTICDLTMASFSEARHNFLAFHIYGAAQMMPRLDCFKSVFQLATLAEHERYGHATCPVHQIRPACGVCTLSTSEFGESFDLNLHIPHCQLVVEIFRFRF